MNCKHNFELVSKAWGKDWKGWMLRCTKCNYSTVEDLRPIARIIAAQQTVKEKIIGGEEDEGK